MGKSGTVYKNILSYFYLAMAIWILGILCKEKALSVLFNRSIVKNSSSYPSI